MNNLYEIDQKFARKLDFKINYYRIRHLIAKSFLKWFLVLVTAQTISIWVYLQKTTLPATLLYGSIYLASKLTLFGSTYTTYVILIKCRLETMHEVLGSSLLLTQRHFFWKFIFC